MDLPSSATLHAIAESALVLALVLAYRRARRLGRSRKALLQEKDVIFGFVHDVGEVFADADNVDVDLLLKRVLFYAMRTTRAAAGAVYLFEPDERSLRARSLGGLMPPLDGGLDASIERTLSKSQHVESLVRSRVVRNGEGLVGGVAESGQPLLIADAERDPRVPAFEQDFLRIHSVLLVPMRFHRKVLGVLGVVNRVDGRPFEQADQSLLQALADQASVSVHYAGLRDTLLAKQRIDHDLDVARQIQNALLPKTIPSVQGVSLAAFYQPAFQIGGDFYDFIPIDEHHLGIALADVSGKGIGGAIVMAMCRSALRARAHGHVRPAEVLISLNRALSEDMPEALFISVLYMVLDTRTWELTLARAGHEKPVLCSCAEGELRQIDSPGIAIGIAPREKFESALREVTVSLKPGDALVAFTDGITEAMNDDNQEWGIENLMDAVRASSGDNAEGVLTNVRERVVRFVGNRPQYDDMTLLALCVDPGV